MNGPLNPRLCSHSKDSVFTRLFLFWERFMKDAWRLSDEYANQLAAIYTVQILLI